MPQRLRVFVSSPGDVKRERLRASLVIDKLAQDYGRFFAIESYLWEHEPMLSSAHFQDAIEPPSAFDIIVLILWSRLGTPLPERTLVREYRGIDGRTPVTGTEWEYEDALKSARENGVPDLLVFRNTSNASINTQNPEERSEAVAQLAALDTFWKLHFYDGSSFRYAFDQYETLDQFAERLEQTLRKVIEQRVKTLSVDEQRARPIWLTDPFRGLEPYEFEHAPIFFGRDAQITKASEQLAANAAAGTAFLLVCGASGSGKSSLVKAAVVSRMMKPQRITGAALLRRAVFRAGAGGADPFLGLAEALTRKTEQAGVGLPELIESGQEAKALATHLRGAAADPGYVFGNALGRLTQTGRENGELLSYEVAKLILVVDQLEELFTVGGISADDRQAFITLLSGLARSGHVWIIATLRTDFWHRAAEISELLPLAEGQGRLDVTAPAPAEQLEIIRKPATTAGLIFETHPQTALGLDAVLAADAAAAPGVLPILSFTLDELYRDAKTRGSANLTHASYAALGGLEGAIAKRADELVDALPEAAQAAVPRVLRMLASVSALDRHVAVSRSAPLASFAEGSSERELVDAMIGARLLVADQTRASPTVRLAHEALIGRWKRAENQLAADQRDLETRATIEYQFKRWRDEPGGARLLRNPDLANAVDLAGRWGGELDAPMRDYIRRSGRRARLAQTLTAAVALVFFIVAVAAAVEGFRAQSEEREAEQNYRLAIDQAAGSADTLNRGFIEGAINSRLMAELVRRGQETVSKLPRAALDWSYGLLPETEQLLLRRLAVFPAGFTLAAAVAMMNETGLDASTVRDTILNLVSKSLATLDKSGWNSRWFLLETIRAYALEKLAARDEATTAARYHAVYFRDLFAPESDIGSRLSDEDLARRVREIDNVRAALDWCFADFGDPVIGVDLTAAYAPVWLHLSLMAECRERCERALLRLDLDATADTRLRMRLNIALASALIVTLGPVEQTKIVLIQALETADTLNDFDAQARALSTLMTVYVYRGEYGRARIAVERLRQIADRIDDPAIIRTADRLMGTTLLTIGKPREAQQYFERVLQTPRASEERRRMIFYHSNNDAMARAMLARALWMQGFAERALIEADRSLEELQGPDRQLLLCRALYYGVCRIAPMIGDFATADRAITRLIEVATRLSAPFWLTVGRFLEGKLLVERREFARGLLVLQDAFETCSRTGWRMSYPEFKGALAVALGGLGRLAEALDAVNDAVASAGAGDDGQRWYVPELLRIKGEMLLQPAADLSASAAEECFNQATEMAREQGALVWELRVALSRARLRVNQHRRDEAREILRPVYDRFSEGFETIDLRTARSMLDTLSS
jgi:predicted ATPase